MYNHSYVRSMCHKFAVRQASTCSNVFKFRRVMHAHARGVHYKYDGSKTSRFELTKIEYREVIKFLTNCHKG